MTLGKMNWANLLNYEIQPADMELFQTYAKGPSLARLLAERSTGIIFGGVISVVGGLQIQVSAGLALMSDGTLVNWPNTNVTLATAHATLSRIDRIELAYALVNNTAVVDVNNLAKVLDQLYQVTISANQGSNSSSPSANALTSGSLSVGFITIGPSVSVVAPSAISQVVDTNFSASALILGNQIAGIRYNMSSSVLQFTTDGVRWQTLGSGGGGGGGATWQGVSGSAAIESYEYDDRVFLFNQSAAQSMTLWVKTPSSFLPGNQIKLKLGHYSPSSANNWQFQTVSSLVRTGLDAVNSTTNQYSSTNGVVTNSVANMLQSVSYDLTNATGQVNGIYVNPGDLLKVVLSRITPSGTDDTADLRMIPSTTELLFS